MKKEQIIHDIMNIFTTIDSRSQLLKLLTKKETNINPKIVENAEIVASKIEYMKRMLQELRTQIYCEAIYEKKENIDIKSFINLIMNTTKEYNGEIEFYTEKNYTIKEIMINRLHTEGIITNLVENAYEAVYREEDNDKKIKIEITEKMIENDNNIRCFFCNKKINGNEKFLCISITNSSNYDFSNYYKNYTSKNSKYHGCGLQIIDTLLHVDNNHLVIDKSNDKITISIFLKP